MKPTYKESGSVVQYALSRYQGYDAVLGNKSEEISRVVSITTVVYLGSSVEDRNITACERKI